MSHNSKRASIAMTKSRNEKFFICRIVEGQDHSSVLKIPSAFADFFGNLNLNLIGLHLPMKKTWIARYVRNSETIEGIESLMEHYGVNPWYTFCFKYIGGTEFEVELFSEYAVEVDYSNKGSRAVPTEPVFKLNDLDKEKIMGTYSYSSASTFDPELEFVISEKHVGMRSWTEVFKRNEAVEMGLNPEMEWLELGFKTTVWRIHLKWTPKKLFFDSEWQNLAKDCKLGIGDKCLAISTFTHQRFSLAVYHLNQALNIYQKGSVEGKGFLKWFKILHWMNLLTGEVELPYIFADKYGSDLKDRGTIYMPDGMVYSCYLSKQAKLIFGLKDLLKKYNVHADSTLFFEYIGNSTFYATIYDSHGLEVFNDVPSKLLLKSVLNFVAAEVYVISDSDEDEGGGDFGLLHSGGENLAAEQNSDPAMQGNAEAGQYNFSVELLRSHVDNNYHGVFLPRQLLPIYKKWKKNTIVTLFMNSRTYRLAILKRQKTCRLGVGWNEFVLENKLEEGDKILFTYTADATFAVSQTM